jgi:hypothetical protein
MLDRLGRRRRQLFEVAFTVSLALGVVLAVQPYAIERYREERETQMSDAGLLQTLRYRGVHAAAVVTRHLLRLFDRYPPAGGV